MTIEGMGNGFEGGKAATKIMIREAGLKLCHEIS